MDDQSEYLEAKIRKIVRDEIQKDLIRRNILESLRAPELKPDINIVKEGPSDTIRGF